MISVIGTVVTNMMTIMYRFHHLASNPPPTRMCIPPPICMPVEGCKRALEGYEKSAKALGKSCE